MNYRDFVSQLAGKPTLLRAGELTNLAQRADMSLTAQQMEVFEDDWFTKTYETESAVSVIEVSGPILHKAPVWVKLFGMTAYNIIADEFEAALDSGSEHIMFLFDSPGGMVSGAFDMADMIYNARGQKPTSSMVSDSAYSAAFLLASQTDEIATTQTGGDGSVGVVTSLMTFEKALEEMGIKHEYIYAGEHKVDGNPYEDLSEPARKEIQSSVNQSYEMFVNAVARGRDMEPEAVIETQARLYTGQAALEIGFADRLSAERDEIARLTSLTHGGSRQNLTTMKVDTMSDKDNLVGPTADEIQTQIKEAETAAFDLGMEEGTNRALKIMQAGAHAPEVAEKLAGNMKLSADEAMEILTSTPAEDQGSLDSEMAETNPKIADDFEENPQVQISESWGSAFNQAKGVR